MKIRLLTVMVAAMSLACVLAVLAGPLDPPAGPVASSYKTLAEVEPRTAVNASNTPGDAGSLFIISRPGSYYLSGNVTGVAGRHGIRITVTGVSIDLMGFELIGAPGSLDGISSGNFGTNGVTIRNGTIRNWGGHGIDLRTQTIINAVVEDVRLAHNSGYGVAVGDVGVVRNCSSIGNGLGGIFAGASATISHCNADANGNLAVQIGEGISAGEGSTITDCNSTNNTSALSGGVGDIGVGFRTGNRCVIQRCLAVRNRGHGFRLSSDSHITGCTSVENGSGSTVSAGIYVAGDDNQIDANHVVGSDFGIQAIAGGNIIMRNVAAGNGTNYSFVQNNIYGPILDRRIPDTVASTPAVNGFAATSTLGSTDANANYSY